MERLYWVESKNRVCEIMIKSDKKLEVEQRAKGKFITVQAGHTVDNPYVLREANEREAKRYVEKPTHRVYMDKRVERGADLDDILSYD